jgi:glycosyltransferase involved in cell wall biosynthesis
LCSNVAVPLDDKPAAQSGRRRPKLSAVVPCYNEEDVLPLLRQRLQIALDAIDPNWEVLLVDDGSRDRTAAILRQLNVEDPRFKSLTLSRNFGHQAAVSAGLAHARGEIVAVMDADLQDPPEILAECLAQLREGHDIVYAVRRNRQEGWLLRSAYRSFYWLLRAVSSYSIPLDAGDFCVMDRKVVNVLRRMPERNMFVRGMRAWAGFRQTAIAYDRPARAAGETKYPFRKLLTLAADGIFSFSTMPLRLATLLGLTVVGLNLLALTFVFAWRVFGLQFMGHTAVDIPGWAGVVSVGLFVGGIQLLILGIMGEYLARIYDEVKRRPRWVVASSAGVQRRARRG